MSTPAATSCVASDRDADVSLPQVLDPVQRPLGGTAWITLARVDRSTSNYEPRDRRRPFRMPEGPVGHVAVQAIVRLAQHNRTWEHLKLLPNSSHPQRLTAAPAGTPLLEPALIDHAIPLFGRWIGHRLRSHHRSRRLTGSITPEHSEQVAPPRHRRKHASPAADDPEPRWQDPQFSSPNAESVVRLPTVPPGLIGALRKVLALPSLREEALHIVVADPLGQLPGGNP